jgi:hypothetical protein
MDMIWTLNWHFLRLDFLNPRAQMAAVEVVAVLAIIKSMEAQLQRLTQYPRIQHSLNSPDETKTATHYFPYLSRYHRQILRASQKGRQLHVLPQAACQSEVSDRRTHEANCRPHDIDGTQKQVRQDDKPIRISSRPLRVRRPVTTLIHLVKPDRHSNAKNPCDLATLHSPHHCALP